MQNVMMIDNISYKLWEISVPTFILKSDVDEAMKPEGPIWKLPAPRKAMKFNGKYYAYSQIKQKKDDESIPPAPEVHPEGPDSNVADNS